MSYLSDNLKKIRVVKKLNQKAFADIFDLKRSTLASYEEGRAEPKLDLLIRISEYFNLSVDQLLKKRLTVNEILKFQPNFSNQNKDIPFIRFKKIREFIKNLSLTTIPDKFPKISLPFQYFADIDIAIEIKNYDDIFENVILLCQDKKNPLANFFFVIKEDDFFISNKIPENFIKIFSINRLIINNLNTIATNKKLLELTKKIDEIYDFLKLKLDLDKIY